MRGTYVLGARIGEHLDWEGGNEIWREMNKMDLAWRFGAFQGEEVARDNYYDQICWIEKYKSWDISIPYGE